mmetsp:Transcript_135740/g.378193  ORF Transcript_135740/g.378193 Transcript_135740/m.378193 type:complete len:238 (-) Transcript_135740:380-1093(-)
MQLRVILRVSVVVSALAVHGAQAILQRNPGVQVSLEACYHQPHARWQLSLQRTWKRTLLYMALASVKAQLALSQVCAQALLSNQLAIPCDLAFQRFHHEALAVQNWTPNSQGANGCSVWLEFTRVHKAALDLQWVATHKPEVARVVRIDVDGTADCCASAAQAVADQPKQRKIFGELALRAAVKSNDVWVRPHNAVAAHTRGLGIDDFGLGIDDFLLGILVIAGWWAILILAHLLDF